MKFDSSKNVTVRNIKIQNSAKFHIDFYDVVGLTVNNITIYSPEMSPNTDGIHLENTKYVTIRQAHVHSGNYSYIYIYIVSVYIYIFCE